MVNFAKPPGDAGIQLDHRDLLALREAPHGTTRHRPATRRPGATVSRFQGQGMDLREIRAYVIGDDPRRIDPAATARTGQPHIRSLHEDRDDVTLLIADFRLPMLWGSASALRSVRAARFLAREGWQAVQRGGSLGVLTLSGAGIAQLPATTGDRQMSDIAALLAHQHNRALLQPDHAALDQALARAARLVPVGGQIVLATSPDGWQGTETDIARLARRRKLRVAIMLDETETAPPKGILSISHGVNRRTVRLSRPDLGPRYAALRGLGAIPEPVEP